MTIAVLLAYCGALFIAAIIPGPGITAIVARALGSGFRPTFFMGLGLILGDMIYLTAVILGLAFIMNQGYWAATLETLSLVFVSALFSTLIGVPVGIAAAHRPRLFAALQDAFCQCYHHKTGERRWTEYRDVYFDTTRPMDEDVVLALVESVRRRDRTLHQLVERVTSNAYWAFYDDMP